MRARYKRRVVVIAALLAIIFIVLLTLSSRPPATGTALAITFIGYTNALGYTNAWGGNVNCVLFSVENAPTNTIGEYKVGWDFWFFPAIKRPATHPAYMPALELKAGQSVVTAVEEPLDLPTGRWRYVMS